jgi:hypothetical protein
MVRGALTRGCSRRDRCSHQEGILRICIITHFVLLFYAHVCIAVAAGGLGLAQNAECASCVAHMSTMAMGSSVFLLVMSVAPRDLRPPFAWGIVKCHGDCAHTQKLPLSPASSSA